MIKFLKVSMWMSLLGGIVMLGTNFSVPPEMVKSPSIQKILPTMVEPAEDKRFVQIEGKIYEYNPKNVYEVDGVKTLYKGAVFSEKQMMARAGADSESTTSASDRGALQKVQQMVDNGVLSAYGPGGFQAIVDGAQEAKAKMEERNKALNQLMNE